MANCDGSGARGDSIENSPEGPVIPSSKEVVIDEIFSKCDEDKTGVVKVSTIIKFVEQFFDSNSTDSRVFALKNLLDPEGNDLSIDKDSFTVLSRKWIAKIEGDIDDISTLPDVISKDIDSVSKDSLFTESTINTDSPTVLKGCGESSLLDLSETSGVSMTDKISGIEKYNYQEKINELSYQNKNLIEELGLLKNQLCISDEQNEVLQKKLEQVRRKSIIDQKGIEELKQLQAENDSIRETNESYKKQNEKLLSQLATSKKDYSQLLPKMDALEIEIKSNEEKIGKLNFKLQEACAEIISLQEAVLVKDELNNTLDKDNIDLRMMLAEQQRDIEHFQHEMLKFKNEKICLEQYIQSKEMLRGMFHSYSITQIVQKSSDNANKVEADVPFKPAIENENFKFFNYDSPFTRAIKEQKIYNSPRLLKMLSSPVDSSLVSPDNKLMSINQNTPTEKPNQSDETTSDNIFDNSGVAVHETSSEHDLFIQLKLLNSSEEGHTSLQEEINQVSLGLQDGNQKSLECNLLNHNCSYTINKQNNEISRLEIEQEENNEKIKSLETQITELKINFALEQERNNILLRENCELKELQAMSSKKISDFELEFNELKLKTINHSTNIESLNKENTEKYLKILKIEEENEKLFKLLNDEKKTCLEDREKHESRIQELINEKNSLLFDLKRLERENNSLLIKSSKIKDLNEQIIQLSTKHQVTCKELQIAHENNAKLKNELFITSKFKDDMEEMQKEIEYLKDELSCKEAYQRERELEYMTDKEIMSEQYSDILEKYDTTKKENEALLEKQSNKISELEAKILELQQLLKEKQKCILQLTNDNKSLKNSNNLLTKTKNKLETGIKLLEANNEEKDKQLLTLEKHKLEQVNNVKSLNNELKNLKEKIEMLEVELNEGSQRNEEKISSLQKEKQILTNKFNLFKSELKMFFDKYMQEKQSHLEMYPDHTELEHELTELKVKLLHVLKSRDVRIDELLEERVLILEENSDYRDKISELSLENRLIQERALVDINKLDVKLKIKEDTILNNCKEISKIKENLDNLQKVNLTLLQENHKLISRCEQLEDYSVTDNAECGNCVVLIQKMDHLEKEKLNNENNNKVAGKTSFNKLKIINDKLKNKVELLENDLYNKESHIRELLDELSMYKEELNTLRKLLIRLEDNNKIIEKLQFEHDNVKTNVSEFIITMDKKFGKLLAIIEKKFVSIQICFDNVKRLTTLMKTLDKQRFNKMEWSPSIVNETTKSAVSEHSIISNDFQINDDVSQRSNDNEEPCLEYTMSSNHQDKIISSSPSFSDNLLQDLNIIMDRRMNLTESETTEKFFQIVIAFAKDKKTMEQRLKTSMIQHEQMENRLVEKYAKLNQLIDILEITHKIPKEKTQALKLCAEQILEDSSTFMVSAEQLGALKHEKKLMSSVKLIMNHIIVLTKNLEKYARLSQCTRFCQQNLIKTDNNWLEQEFCCPPNGSTMLTLDSNENIPAQTPTTLFGRASTYIKKLLSWNSGNILNDFVITTCVILFVVMIILLGNIILEVEFTKRGLQMPSYPFRLVKWKEFWNRWKNKQYYLGPPPT